MITDRISLLEKAISSNISYQNLESLLTLIGQEQKEIKFPIWIKKSSESRKKELYDIFSKKKELYDTEITWGACDTHETLRLWVRRLS